MSTRDDYRPGRQLYQIVFDEEVAMLNGESMDIEYGPDGMPARVMIGERSVAFHLEMPTNG